MASTSTDDSGDRATSAVAKLSPYERLQHDLETDPRVTQDIVVGKRIGFYRLKGTLGSGTFSKVKVGIHLLTGERVAMKIIDKTKLDDQARQLLSREISCMECLNHPNIIRLLEVIETFTHTHIAMECATEGDLQGKVAKNGPMSEDVARGVFSQVVLAMRHIHSKGIFHRDLKAENVFFVNGTHIKIGDFGFSTNSTDSLLDTFCGSPPYASPELFSEQSYAGALVDIWAMGVLLFYTLSGNLPFRGDTIPQLKDNVISATYSVPSRLSPASRDLIAGMLTKDPAGRFQMEGIVQSAWMADSVPLTDGEPASTLSAGVEESVDRELVEALAALGVPTTDREEILGEPRSAITGTYRILLHRKHGLAPEGEPERGDRTTGAKGRSGPMTRQTSGRPAKAGPTASPKKITRFCVVL